MTPSHLHFLMLSGFPVENGLEVGCGCLDWWPLQYPGDKGTTFSLMKNWGRKWQQWCEQPTLWPSDLTLFLGNNFIFEGCAVVPLEWRKSQGGPQLGHSQRCWGPARLAVLGPGSQEACPVVPLGPCEHQPAGLGDRVGNLALAADFQRLPGAGLG